jgi:hypothetical protein
LEEVEGLKHISDFFGAQTVAPGFPEGGHLGAIDGDLTAVGGEDAGHEMQEGRLARATFTTQGELLARREGEPGDIHDFHAHAFGRHEGFFQIGDGEHGAEGQEWARRTGLPVVSCRKRTNPGNLPVLTGRSRKYAASAQAS